MCDYKDSENLETSAPSTLADTGIIQDNDDSIETLSSNLAKIFILILSVIGGSMIGPVANEVPTKGIFLKNVWRYFPL